MCQKTRSKSIKRNYREINRPLVRTNSKTFIYITVVVTIALVVPRPTTADKELNFPSENV